MFKRSCLEVPCHAMNKLRVCSVCFLLHPALECLLQFHAISLDFSPRPSISRQYHELSLGPELSSECPLITKLHNYLCPFLLQRGFSRGN
jgi:hypothetical protein